MLVSNQTTVITIIGQSTNKSEKKREHYGPLETAWFSWIPLSDGDGVCCLRGSRCVNMSVNRLYSCARHKHLQRFAVFVRCRSQLARH